jgi:hypothetical protein
MENKLLRAKFSETLFCLSNNSVEQELTNGVSVLPSEGALGCFMKICGVQQKYSADAAKSVHNPTDNSIREFFVQSAVR